MGGDAPRASARLQAGRVVLLALFLGWCVLTALAGAWVALAFGAAAAVAAGYAFVRARPLSPVQREDAVFRLRLAVGLLGAGAVVVGVLELADALA